MSALTDIENGPSFADELQCVPRNQPRPIEISAHCGQIALQVFIDAIVGCSLRDRRRDCRFLASDPVERAASSPFFRWMKKRPWIARLSTRPFRYWYLASRTRLCRMLLERRAKPKLASAGFGVSSDRKRLYLTASAFLTFLGLLLIRETKDDDLTSPPR